MKTVAAETLVYNCSQIDIWDLPDDFYNVIFSDKECVMHKHQLIGSWYYWQLYSFFPEMPIHSKSAVTEFFTSSTHGRILGFIHWDIYNRFMLTHDISVWEISGLVCEVSNRIFNMTCVEIVEYMALGSIHDIVEILNYPAIVEAKRKYKETVEGCNYNEFITSTAIAELDKVVTDILYRHPEILPHNAIKRLATTGLVNKNQLFQLIALRGYVKDINDDVFPYPMSTAYSEGSQDLYEITCESRDASNAKLMQTAPLQLSEYFNRKNQLCTCIITTCLQKLPFRPLEEGGCTGYITSPFPVCEDDCISLKGKFHMVDGKPELLWDNVSDYIGQVIQLRSISGCGSPNPQHICHICVGWSSLIMIPKINYGYKVASESGKIMTSRILSTKHLTKSTISSVISLDQTANKWLVTKSNVPASIFLREELGKATLRFKINSLFVKLLNQIQHISISELSPAAITRIPRFQLARVDEEGQLIGGFDLIKLEISGVGVSMSSDLLSYLKQHSYVVHKNYIEFDLSKWNCKLPLFITPNKGENVMTFFNEIKDFLEGRAISDQARISKCRTRASALNEFVTIMKNGMGGDGGYNITHLEIIIKGLMVVDNEDVSDYGMPMPGDEIRFESIKRVIANRSLGSML